MKIAAGTVITITEGAYSNYQIVGHFRALKNFDTKDVLAKFKSCDEFKPLEWKAVSGFMAWAIREKILEPDDSPVEWYLGGYGELDVDE